MLMRLLVPDADSPQPEDAMNATRRPSLAALLSILAVTALLVAGRAWGLVTTFTGTNNWNVAGNWDPRVPLDGDEAVVYGHAVLTGSTAVLSSSLLTTNSTLSYMGTNTFLRATNVSAFGTITHSNNLATSTNPAGVWPVSNRVAILVYSDLLIGDSGHVDADGRGYRGDDLARLIREGPP
jgi:hypothetical protein